MLNGENSSEIIVVVKMLERLQKERSLFVPFAEKLLAVILFSTTNLI